MLILVSLERVIITFFFFIFFWYFCIFMPLPPLRGQPAVAMPTLLAPQEGNGMFLQAGVRDAGCEPGTAE